MMDEMFLLKKLNVKHKNHMLCDIMFLPDDFSSNNTPIITAIIGMNGSGKSFILMVLVDIFNALDTRKTTNLKYDYYSVYYEYDGDTYFVEIENRNIKCSLNDKIVNISEIKLPTKVLGVAYMLNDKFRFKELDEAVYQYLGVRQTSNASWTSSISRKVSENFLDIFSRNSFDVISDIMHFLDLDSKITFLIVPKTKEFFSRKKSINDLKKRRDRQLSKRFNNYRQDKLEKLDESTLSTIFDFLNEIKCNKMYSKDSNENENLQIDITADTALDFKSKNLLNYKVIRMLNDLEYIQSISLCLYKNKESFLFEEASSGEKHYIFEMSSIVRSIKKHSLILIDEPELSMHPNWQIKYVKTLGKIFSKYRSCHFVISTHSHYIVSDIDPNSSALVSLEYIPEHKKREAILIPYSTYAWSADNILYNVFKVRTTRNWYFEQDIRKLIKYIETKSQEKLDITKLIDKLSKYQLNNDDPLIKLIEEGKRYADLL